MPDDVHWKEYVDERFAAQDKGVLAALASAEKAVDKAEVAAERWRNAANEWRGAMADRERDFLTRREFYSILVTMTVIVGAALAVASRGGM